ncbi:hypothetical protein EST38_g12021 [Candolleomyces aberdarensis]|uniref:Uncharacterized protein n=1 Tax=Candolleomyces aberdarensis TaxID=2316362 RepID=A0A4Q2D5Q4_9AGAR|nr:hypothetical protein EST38_g12021 [Candolleomyces aberdarensis]
MFWGANLLLTFSLAGLVFGQSPLCGTNPDGATFYSDVVDKALPKALAEYNTAAAAFASSKATPEDIDDLFHASEAYYRQYLNTVVFRNCTTAPTALATAFNSTSKLRELRRQPLNKVMNAFSRFELQILAQGSPGHWANYQPLDYLAYSSWYAAKIFVRRLAKGKPSALEDEFVEWYNAVEAVRAQYYREGYGKQPRPEA